MRLNCLGSTFNFYWKKVDSTSLHSPLGRIAEPEDIADIALFLAGDAARHVTGQVIVADGGMMLSGF